MIDPTRFEILQRLAELSVLDPEQRFGQLISNLANLAIGPSVEAIWDVEDTELLGAINEHISNLDYRRATLPDQSHENVVQTAAKWQGDFERPPQGQIEEREPLS
jgi:hypothetical protein